MTVKWSISGGKSGRRGGRSTKRSLTLSPRHPRSWSALARYRRRHHQRLALCGVE
jgi:hypothetical protein